VPIQTPDTILTSDQLDFLDDFASICIGTGQNIENRSKEIDEHRFLKSVFVSRSKSAKRVYCRNLSFKTHFTTFLMSF